jgi:YegS/Rv2252/BmrU family lipid kinase
MTRRAIFLYNPVSGRGLTARIRVVEDSAELWRNAGYETEMVATTGPGSAAKQAGEIVDDGCDVLFACGGDGTVHEVLQALVATKTPTALAVLPLGTGNVIANNLGLPHGTAVAAAIQLQYVPRRIAVGEVTSTFAEGGVDRRYFLAAAGLGMHAKMIEQANSSAKNRSGMTAYYRAGFRLVFLEEMCDFAVELTLPNGSTEIHQAHELLAIKVAQFSGIVRRWRPGSSLLDPTLQIALVKTKSRTRVLTGTVRCMIGGAPKLKGVDLVRAVRAVCRPLASGRRTPIVAEADGEVLGTLPVEISVVPDALTLLMPQS